MLAQLHMCMTLYLNLFLLSLPILSNWIDVVFDDSVGKEMLVISMLFTLYCI